MGSNGEAGENGGIYSQERSTHAVGDHGQEPAADDEVEEAANLMLDFFDRVHL